MTFLLLSVDINCHQLQGGKIVCLFHLSFFNTFYSLLCFQDPELNWKRSSEEIKKKIEESVQIQSIEHAECELPQLKSQFNLIKFNLLKE
jgi:hypothetical protein